jgi:hypothetical protein
MTAKGLQLPSSHCMNYLRNQERRKRAEEEGES